MRGRPEKGDWRRPATVPNAKYNCKSLRLQVEAYNARTLRMLKNQMDVDNFDLLDEIEPEEDEEDEEDEEEGEEDESFDIDDLQGAGDEL